MHARTMLAICIRYVKNFEEAEEAMLTAFQKFFEKIDMFDYRGEGSESAYIKKMAINQCLMLLRKRNNLIYDNEFPEATIDNNEDAIDKMSAKEIFQMITELPDGCRTIFNLFAIEGKTHKEIAQLLNISEGTSKSQVNRARKILQSAIQKNNIIENVQQG